MSSHKIKSKSSKSSKTTRKRVIGHENHNRLMIELDTQIQQYNYPKSMDNIDLLKLHTETEKLLEKMQSELVKYRKTDKKKQYLEEKIEELRLHKELFEIQHMSNREISDTKSIMDRLGKIRELETRLRVIDLDRQRRTPQYKKLESMRIKEHEAVRKRKIDAETEYQRQVSEAIQRSQEAKRQKILAKEKRAQFEREATAAIAFKKQYDAKMAKQRELARSRAMERKQKREQQKTEPTVVQYHEKQSKQRERAQNRKQQLPPPQTLKPEDIETESEK